MKNLFVDRIAKSRILLNYEINDFFNEKNDYLFYENGRFFISKVHLYNGYYYTNESCQYKANTLQCVDLGSKGLCMSYGFYSGSYIKHDFKSNCVDISHLLVHIDYNLSNRFGRSLFINDQLLYGGLDTELKSEQHLSFQEKIRENPQWVKNECSAPYQ